MPKRSPIRQFQAEWAKDGQVFVCRNCHTPLQNQQETVVTGLIAGDYHRPVEAANPSFDPALRTEAITCAVCHVRDGFVIGPYGNDAPHAVRQDPALLSAQACLNCHNVQGELSPTLVCTFTTGDEWQRSPYPARGETCITCHMPEVQRPNVPDHQVPFFEPSHLGRRRDSEIQWRGRALTAVRRARSRDRAGQRGA